ncbi:MAG TPA: nuclease-related domain-containing protein [Solirubrobacterales bacterium]|jgi:hypothetical protein|nr:nuclease-related domain-containing protein [Solirubrobacterales bacterium]
MDADATEMDASDEQPVFDSGTAGASARREYERRKANRERRTREKHPHIGGLLVALQNGPTHEQVWAQGSGGEQRIAKLLARHLHEDVVLLHDRAVPRSPANIDHIAVAPSGVWVIDAKCYNGKVTVKRPLFGKSKLVIAGRNKTNLIDGLAKQVAVVETVMADIAPLIQIRGALCFIDSELPMFGTLTMRGYPLLHAKSLAERINAGGVLPRDGVQAIAALLATHLPAA